MYSEKLMQVFANPKNVGIIKMADGMGETTNEFGEVVKFFINVEDGVVVDSKFKAYGGVLVIASASILTTMVVNQKLEDIVNISVEDIINTFDCKVEEDRISSVMIAKDAMLLAVKAYNDKQ